MYSGILKENSIFNSLDESWSGFECVWSSPPSILNIADNEVHIWRIRLDIPLKAIKSFKKILCNDEQLKASKFRLKADRRRYKASHGSLRKILGKYLCLDPKAIEYTYHVINIENNSTSGNWTILRFKPAHNYTAGLAVKGKDKYTYKFYDFFNE